MQNHLISVLMPAFNASTYIVQAIECILNQTYRNFELLIADDASTDSTKQIIDEFAMKDSRIVTLHNQENLGYLKTWNKLILQAKGEFIAFQDADDFSSFSRIQLQLEFLEKNPEVSLVGCNFSYVDASGRKSVSTSSYPLTDSEVRTFIPDVVPFCGSSIMIKREVYEEVGGYREYFDRIGAEDYDWILLVMEKFRVANIPDVLYYYRLSENSVTRTFTYEGRRKLFAAQMVKFLYEQRLNAGRDCLQNHQPETLNAFEKELDNPFSSDESYFYWFIGKKLFYEGKKADALAYLKQAIIKNPLNHKYYKDYFYFLRTTPPAVI